MKIQRRFYVAILSLAILALRPVERAQAQARGGKVSAPSNPQSINFEGEVIEGEQGIPSLLQNFDAQGATLDLIVLKRSDFNDFYKRRIDVPFRYQASQEEKE